MNQEQAKAWLPLIQAAAEGKTLQKAIYKFAQDSQGKDIYKWSDDFYELKELFSLNLGYIRIKPEPKKQWYRVALLKSSCGHVWTDTIKGRIEQIEKEPQFVRWLTDRIEYELPEGEA